MLSHSNRQTAVCPFKNRAVGGRAVGGRWTSGREAGRSTGICQLLGVSFQSRRSKGGVEIAGGHAPCARRLHSTGHYRRAPFASLAVEVEYGVSVGLRGVPWSG